MIVKLLTEHHLEFLSLKEGCRCSSESTLVKMPHCWKYMSLLKFHLLLWPYYEIWLNVIELLLMRWWNLNATCIMVCFSNWLINGSALAVNCCIIVHCLEVSCKEDQITSLQPEWFIFVQLMTNSELLLKKSRTRADLFWFKHNKNDENTFWSVQLLPTFCHCTEEFPPIVGLYRICLLVLVTYFNCKKGGQWLSGRVLDSRPRGSGFDPHWHHCAMFLSKTH